MKIRARRGVCIGVDKHLKAGEEADLDGAVVTFLTGIGAVEVVKDAPAEVTAEVSDAGLASGPSKQDSIKPDAKTAPAESGKNKK